MAQYTRLEENDIQSILREYDLEVIGYEPVEQGANSTYLISTNEGRHILTIFEWDPIQISNACKVLLMLEKYDFPAPRLKRMRNGEVLTQYQEKAVLIKPYMTGQVLEALTVGQVKQVGVALGKLHQIPAPSYLPDNHSFVQKTYPLFMGQAADRGYKKWVEERHRSIIENIPHKLPVGLVHGDIFCDNLLFEDQKFKAILDFEDVSRTFKLLDLGMTVVGICTDDTEIELLKARALVKGYQEIRLLEVAEKNSLQEFIEWAAILTSIWRFWAYNIEMPAIDKSSKYLQMVHIAKHARAIPKREFIHGLFAG